MSKFGHNKQRKYTLFLLWIDLKKKKKKRYYKTKDLYITYILFLLTLDDYNIPIIIIME